MLRCMASSQVSRDVLLRREKRLGSQDPDAVQQWKIRMYTVSPTLPTSLLHKQ